MVSTAASDISITVNRPFLNSIVDDRCGGGMVLCQGTQTCIKKQWSHSVPLMRTDEFDFLLNASSDDDENNEWLMLFD